MYKAVIVQHVASSLIVIFILIGYFVTNTLITNSGQSRNSDKKYKIKSTTNTNTPEVGSGVFAFVHYGIMIFNKS